LWPVLAAVEAAHDELAASVVEDEALQGHTDLRAISFWCRGCRGCRYLSLLLSLYAFSLHLPPKSSFSLKQFEKKYLHPLQKLSFSASRRQINQTQPSTQVSTNPLLSRCNPLPVNVEGCGTVGRHLPTTNAPLEVLTRRPGRSGGRWLQPSQSRVAPNHRQHVLRIVGGGRCRHTNPYIRCRVHWLGP
jgi:hypothetical protein